MPVKKDILSHRSDVFINVYKCTAGQLGTEFCFQFNRLANSLVTLTTNDMHVEKTDEKSIEKIMYKFLRQGRKLIKLIKLKAKNVHRDLSKVFFNRL